MLVLAPANETRKGGPGWTDEVEWKEEGGMSRLGAKEGGWGGSVKVLPGRCRQKGLRSAG